ncbi:MAG: hypothetical protein WAV89_01200 [Ignavibacteriaceae bacterium]
MAIEEIMLNSERFIKLELTDTKKDNVNIRNIAYIQIVYPVNKDSYTDINSIKNRYEAAIQQNKKRKHLFAITLNVE